LPAMFLMFTSDGFDDLPLLWFISTARLCKTQVISGLRNKSAVGVDAKQTQRPKALHGLLPTEWGMRNDANWRLIRSVCGFDPWKTKEWVTWDNDPGSFSNKK
jgi:hypothetical protein